MLFDLFSKSYIYGAGAIFAAIGYLYIRHREKAAIRAEKRALDAEACNDSLKEKITSIIKIRQEQENVAKNTDTSTFAIDSWGVHQYEDNTTPNQRD